MQGLGWSKRCLEIVQDYVNRREGFGIRLADCESVQIKLGRVAQRIQIGRLLTMHAAWKLDLEWIYRAARAARIVDGASEVHNMVLARFLREEGRDFWSWSAGNRI